MKHRALLSVILMLVFLPCSTPAQWMWLYPPHPPGELKQIVFADTAMGFILGGEGLLLTTLDGGTTWDFAQDDRFRGMHSISFPSPTSGFLCGDQGGILKTYNGGETWNPLNSGTDQQLLSIHFLNNQYGAACGAGGTVIVTSNGGGSWRTSVTGTDGTLHDIQIIHDSLAVAVGDGFLMIRSTDGMHTWSVDTLRHCTIQGGGESKVLNNVNFLNDSLGVSVGVLYKNSEVGISTFLKTSDRGLSWSMVCRSYPYPLTDAIMPDSSTALYCFGVSIHQSTDGGLSFNYGWKSGTGELRSFGRSSTNKIWVCGTEGTVASTTDGGVTWTDQDRRAYSDINDIVFPEESSGWCVGDRGMILRTNNAGFEWVRQQTGTTEHLLAVDAPLRTVGVAAGRNGTVLHTQNGGETWNLIPTGTMVHLTGVSFADTLIGFICGEGGTVLKTIKGGSQWNQIYTGVNSNLMQIQAFPDGSVYALANTFLLKSTDFGTTWSVKNPPSHQYLTGMHFRNSAEGRVVGLGRQYYQTSNGGENWQIRHFLSAPYEFQQVMFSTELHGYILCREGDDSTKFFLKTTDGGVSWNRGEVGINVPLTDFLFFSDSVGYLVCKYGGILKSTGGVLQGIGKADEFLPETAVLSQNYPNPFNPETNIMWSVPEPAEVTLRVYNVLGQLVRELHSGYALEGQHTSAFHADDLPSGVYFYRLQAGEFIQTRKMVLLR